MTTPEREKWKLVPVEPTVEMLDDGYEAFVCSTIHHRLAIGESFKAMLSAAPTPPEVEPVESIGHICQYTYENLESHGLVGWHDCPDNDLKYYAERGEKTRTLYMYVDQPTLYTSPSSPKAEYDAEGNPLTLLAAAKDLEILLSRAVTVKMPGHESSRKYSNTMQYLRKFIGES